MSEYWKSNPKKFCEYCKIWIQANKASISIHENGKNHKDNVRKRLQEIKKKSVEKKNEEKEFGKSMAAIERAAVAAMQNDLLNNPLLRNQYGLETKSQDNFSNSKPTTSKPKIEQTKVFRHDKPVKRHHVPESLPKNLESKDRKRALIEENVPKTNLELSNNPAKTEISQIKKEDKESKEETEIDQNNLKSKWKPIENFDSFSKIENQESINDLEADKAFIKEEPKVEEVPVLKNSSKREKIIKFKKRSKDVNLRKRTDE